MFGVVSVNGFMKRVFRLIEIFGVVVLIFDERFVFNVIFVEKIIEGFNDGFFWIFVKDNVLILVFVENLGLVDKI